MTVPATIRMRLCIEDPAGRGPRSLTELLAQAEHLPIGAAREHWQPEALHRADRELMELERRQRDAVLYACRRLSTRLHA